MKLRRIMYRFMNVDFLRNRVEKNHTKLEITKDSKERMKLIEENFDILEALIYKNRYNKGFMKMVREDLSDLINKPKAEESK